MTSSNLIRLCGLAVVMAAALLLITEIVGYTQGGDPFKVDASATHAFESALRMIAFVVLLPLGLVGLYARQSEAAGPLGCWASWRPSPARGLWQASCGPTPSSPRSWQDRPPSSSKWALPRGARSRCWSSA